MKLELRFSDKAPEYADVDRLQIHHDGVLYEIYVRSSDNGLTIRKDHPMWEQLLIEPLAENVIILRSACSMRSALPRRCKLETNPQTFIDGKISSHRSRVRELMGEIQKVCAQLGVPFHHALVEAETPTGALVVAHGVENVKTYEKALVKAKDKTLPELFEKVKEQHKAMATWMNAELIPAQAELVRAKGITEVIEGKIHTVELYAGLQERLVQVREGEPASADTKVHIMQRRCYMDEECLADYDAGGMDFEKIDEFDKWLARPHNMRRILPHDRCIVAMRVRRHSKSYGGSRNTLADFIKFGEWNEANKWTFLYIRNGQQLWRMSTSTSFGAELFERREGSDILGDDELWYDPNQTPPRFITGRERHGEIESWKTLRSYCAQLLWQWHRAGKPDGKRKKRRSEDDEGSEDDPEWTYVAIDHEHERYSWKKGEPHTTQGDPRRFPFGLIDHDIDRARRPEWKRYERITPEHIYHDDAMKQIQQQAFETNRVAVIIQGLLDRSTCLHPHPPWRIWTPEGFAAGIVLVYDRALAITPGMEPDWRGYRAQLNKSIRVGAVVMGQRRAWAEAMEEEYGEKWRHQDKVGEGPKALDHIVAIRGGKAQFKFTRRRRRAIMQPIPDEPGWLRHTYPEIEMSWWCPLERLTCIDAYTPGDYHMFFDDPRTRADYIRWAPVLLTAENYHAKRREAESTPTVEPKAKAKRKEKTALDHAAETIFRRHGMVPLSDEDEEKVAPHDDSWDSKYDSNNEDDDE